MRCVEASLRKLEVVNASAAELAPNLTVVRKENVFPYFAETQANRAARQRRAHWSRSPAAKSACKF